MGRSRCGSGSPPSGRSWSLGLGILVRRSWVIGLLSRGAVLAIPAALLGVLALGWFLLFDTLRLAQLRLVRPATRRAAVALTAVGMLLTSGTRRCLLECLRGPRRPNSVFGGSTAADDASGGRYNILLLGGDSGADRYSTRPDSITVVSVDADTGRPVMFGFARDTENIHFRAGSVMARLMPKGWACGDKCLLNALYCGDRARQRVPARDGRPGDHRDGGGRGGAERAGHPVLRPHRPQRAFQSLIDAVGGLEIDVKERTIIGQPSDKAAALYRAGTSGAHRVLRPVVRPVPRGASNYDRMARQRCVMQAMLEAAEPDHGPHEVPGHSRGELPGRQDEYPAVGLGTMTDLALKAKGQKITSVNFVRRCSTRGRTTPRSSLDKVAATISASTAAPADPAPTTATKTKTTTKGSTRPGSTPVPQTDDVAAVCSL